MCSLALIISCSYLVKEAIRQILPWALNRFLFLRMRYLKWMRIFKRWFNRFFLYTGMKIEFLLSTGFK